MYASVVGQGVAPSQLVGLTEVDCVTIVRVSRRSGQHDNY